MSASGHRKLYGRRLHHSNRSPAKAPEEAVEEAPSCVETCVRSRGFGSVEDLLPSTGETLVLNPAQQESDNWPVDFLERTWSKVTEA